MEEAVGNHECGDCGQTLDGSQSRVVAAEIHPLVGHLDTRPRGWDTCGSSAWLRRAGGRQAGNLQTGKEPRMTRIRLSLQLRGEELITRRPNCSALTATNNAEEEE